MVYLKLIWVFITGSLYFVENWKFSLILAFDGANVLNDDYVLESGFNTGEF